MFWCERLRHDDTFCICEAAWEEIRFADILFYSDTFQLRATPEHGKECTILRLRNGETIPSVLNVRLGFQLLQHVRLRVIGGEITLFGSIYPNSSVVSRNERDYPALCPFSDAEIIRNNEKNQRQHHHPSDQNRHERIGELLNQDQSNQLNKKYGMNMS